MVENKIKPQSGKTPAILSNRRRDMVKKMLVIPIEIKNIIVSIVFVCGDLELIVDFAYVYRCLEFAILLIIKSCVTESLSVGY